MVNILTYAITTWHWTPDTWSHEYRFVEEYHFIKSNNKIQILSENEWVDTGLIEPLTQENFETYGMNDLRKLTQITDKYIKTMEYDRDEGDGKIYKAIINASKFNNQIQKIIL